LNSKVVNNLNVMKEYVLNPKVIALLWFLFIISCEKKSDFYEYDFRIDEYESIDEGPILHEDLIYDPPVYNIPLIFDCSEMERTDVECYELPRIIAKYVDHCAVYQKNTNLQPNASDRINLSLKYYIDRDGDVNLGNYKSVIDGHIQWIDNYYSQAGLPITNISANMFVPIHCASGMRTEVVHYTVEYVGNAF